MITLPFSSTNPRKKLRPNAAEKKKHTSWQHKNHLKEKGSFAYPYIAYVPISNCKQLTSWATMLCQLLATFCAVKIHYAAKHCKFIISLKPQRASATFQGGGALVCVVAIFQSLLLLIHLQCPTQLCQFCTTSHRWLCAQRPASFVLQEPQRLFITCKHIILFCFWEQSFKIS